MILETDSSYQELIFSDEDTYFINDLDIFLKLKARKKQVTKKFHKNCNAYLWLDILMNNEKDWNWYLDSD